MPDSSSPAQVTALLPIGPGFNAETLGRAAASLGGQTRPPAELLVVANGLRADQRGSVEAALARGAGALRVRTLWREEPGLAGALNAGLREAATDVVARMDADDACGPDRLRVQADALAAAPELAGVGCAWRVVGPDGADRGTMRPPTDPRRLRWMLRLGNRFAHGSMMLRCARVLEAGGYDELLPKAQDYDLWLRLTRDGPALGAVGDVLYTYHESQGEGVGASSTPQASAASAALLASWGDLPPVGDQQRRALEAAIAGAMSTENGGGVAEAIEVELDRQPTRESLVAWLWARDRFPPMPRRAIEIARRARLREVGRLMHERGVSEVWLWGAGRHGAWVLEHAPDLGLRIAGFVDDRAAGQTRSGHAVAPADSLAPGAHALLCSDWHEDAMWEQSASARARGITTWRLYADTEPRS
ncbi:MAG: glycosyltransferase [Phycisphaerales bacterium]|nr:glycosyltransferase [Phycisphaerales bacterium]MCB9840817.1 glycosyltransferase [Phycisphaeraceae bacterium]